MLTVTNLSFRYSQRRLFDDLSFTIKAGELVHFAGPNGCGKSTLMSVIAGLLTATSGKVEFFAGEGAVAPSADRRAFTEYLPAEANGLFLKLDATANLNFWKSLRGSSGDPQVVAAALARWGLDHALLRTQFPVEKFSTGMKRRLALARIALSPAPLWLLDEPVYGLDDAAIGIFRDMLGQHLQRGGMAAIVSHDQKALTGLATKTIAMGGRP